MVKNNGLANLAHFLGLTLNPVYEDGFLNGLCPVNLENAKAVEAMLDNLEASELNEYVVKTTPFLPEHVTEYSKKHEAYLKEWAVFEYIYLNFKSGGLFELCRDREMAGGILKIMTEMAQKSQDPQFIQKIPGAVQALVDYYRNSSGLGTVCACVDVLEDSKTGKFIVIECEQSVE